MSATDRLRCPVLLSAENIQLSFGSRAILDGVSLRLDPGERVGLIGPNGAGKSTLIRVITAALKPDAGNVTLARGATMGLLEQDPTFTPGETLIDAAEGAFAELHQLAHEMRELEHQMGEADVDLDAVLGKYEETQAAFDRAGGHAWRHKLEAALHGVGLPESDWEKDVNVLSGGQRSRLALAKLLVQEPDVLLLDEPTNHLDLQAVDWLEDFLKRYSGAVLLISHDRELLDKLATRIVHLQHGSAKSYPGNYEAYQELRALDELTQQRQYDKQQADIEKQKEYIRRFKAGQRAKEARGRETRLNRFLKSGDVLDTVRADDKARLKLDGAAKPNTLALRCRELAKSFGKQALWRDVKFDLLAGDRMGIIGPNGSGKTTMLKVLLGDEPADGGETRWGPTVKVGYYDQRLDKFDPENTVLTETQSAAPKEKKVQEVRNLLAALLFRGDTVDKRMALLSGGEKARVALAKLLLQGCDCLLMDEPTNHLDIPTREALERALSDYEGTLVCVSHDRYFLRRMCDRLLVLDPPKVLDFEGGFDEWHDRKDALAAKAPAPKKQSQPIPQKQVAKPQPKPQQKKDNKYARPFGTLSMEKLEADITDTEIVIAELQEKFGDIALMADESQSKRLQAEYAAAEKKLEQLEAEYYLRGEA